MNTLRISSRLRLLLCIPVAALMASCGLSQGAFLYMMGVGSRATVKAKFDLTDEPILILIDDASARINWPPTPRYLQEELSNQLIRERGAKRIIPRKTLDNVRRVHSDYHSLSAREIGSLCRAEQVLWIEVEQYVGEVEFVEPNHASWFAVFVKVIDSSPELGDRVRRWPMSPRGQYVTVALDGSEVSRLGTRDAISKRLAERLAEEITRLFTDYVPGDFEE